MKHADLRLFDGNGAVARAVGSGDLHIGLTDSDDVFAGQREGWPIAMSFIQCPDPSSRRADRSHPRWAEMQRVAKTGTLLFPNTVSKVRGGQSPAGATAFIDFMLSLDSQRALASGESKNLPVDPALAREFGAWLPPEEHLVRPELEDGADVMEAAMNVCDSILGA